MTGIVYKLLSLSLVSYYSLVCINSSPISVNQQIPLSYKDSVQIAAKDTVAVDTSAVCFVNGKRTSYNYAFTLYHQGKTLMTDYTYSQRDAVENYGEIARNGFYAFINRENYLNE